MKQPDFFGNSQEAPFKDIRNTRPSAAEEKANLCLELGRLCTKPPPGVVNGSVEYTRRWLAAQKDALAVAKNSRSSVARLTAAISNMRGFS